MSAISIRRIVHRIAFIGRPNRQITATFASKTEAKNKKDGKDKNVAKKGKDDQENENLDWMDEYIDIVEKVKK